MGSWMKVDTTLPTDPEILRMAVKLRRERPELGSSCQPIIVGCCMILWAYADAHIDDANHLPIGPDQIDELVGLPGFTALMPPKWLQVINADCVELVDWIEHNGSSAKERAMAQKRQARVRARHDAATRNDAGRFTTTPSGNPTTSVNPASVMSRSGHAPLPTAVTVQTYDDRNTLPTRLDERREDKNPPKDKSPPHARFDSAAVGNSPGAYLAGREFQMADRTLEAWRDVHGVNIEALAAYFQHWELHPQPKRYDGGARLATAKWLAGKGDATQQADLIDTAIRNGWRNLHTVVPRTGKHDVLAGLVRRGRTPEQINADAEREGLNPFHRLDLPETPDNPKYLPGREPIGYKIGQGSDPPVKVNQ